MGIEAIGSVMKRNRLERKVERGFGEKIQVYGDGGGGRPSKTWLEVVENDKKGFGLASADALDHHA